MLHLPIPRPRHLLCNLLDHRGPDHFGFLEVNENIILAHSRLSIQDLNQRSNQPFIFQNLSLVFNGEIYNHAIIRTLLIARGYSFDTESDTETVLKAFHYYGSECFDMFDGMFFCCICAALVISLYSHEIGVEKSLYTMCIQIIRSKSPRKYHR